MNTFVDVDRIYTAIAEELETNTTDKAMWTRLFAECDGDENKTKVSYIKHRAERLIADERKRLGVTAPVHDPEPAPEAATLATTNTEEQVVLPTQRELYRAYLGDKNADYYLKKFEEFDRKGDGLYSSWNWAAFLFGGWLFYRKMYGWFFVFWGIYAISNIAAKADPRSWGSIILFMLCIIFALFANSLYHNRVKKKIAVAQAIPRNARNGDALLALLRQEGGVHAWVIWVAGASIVIGILAAIVIPAFKAQSVKLATDSAVEQNSPKQELSGNSASSNIAVEEKNGENMERLYLPNGDYFTYDPNKITRHEAMRRALERFPDAFGIVPEK